MAYAPRILIVDDEPAVRDLFETVLSQDGYYVTVATTGHQALLRLHDTVFDLIVLDVSLQDSDGLQLLLQIRAESPFSKVLMVSGFMASRLHDMAISKGADGTLAKPIRPHTLRDAVYRLLDPSCAWHAV